MEQTGNAGNLLEAIISSQLYCAPEYKLIRAPIMYNFSLNREQLMVHVTGLDSSIKLMCQQIAQAPSSGLALKNLLPKMIEIDKEFSFLQEIVDKTEAALPKEGDKSELPTNT